MSYPLANALFQWEEGYRELQALRDPRARRLADRLIGAIRDELRRRIGVTFTAAELADFYGRGTDWCLQIAIDVAPAAEGDAQSLADAAFRRPSAGHLTRLSDRRISASSVAHVQSTLRSLRP
jgi:hypothetical protein